MLENILCRLYLRGLKSKEDLEDAIVRAIMDRNLPKLKCILERYPEISDYLYSRRGETLLHLVAREGWLEGAKYVLSLSNGEDLYKPNRSFGDTPLHTLIECWNEYDRYDRFEIAKRILNKDKRAVNLVNKDLQTPLHLAAMTGDRKLIRLLIRSGANVFIMDKYGRTALDYALAFGHNDIASYLEEHGAESKLKYLLAHEGLVNIAKKYIRDIKWRNSRCPKLG